MAWLSKAAKNKFFGFLHFFAKFRPASRDPSLKLRAPFWTPGNVFTAQGLEKRKKPKNFESEAKNSYQFYTISLLRGCRKPRQKPGRVSLTKPVLAETVADSANLNTDGNDNDGTTNI